MLLAWNSSHSGDRQEDHVLEAILGYVVRLLGVFTEARGRGGTGRSRQEARWKATRGVPCGAAQRLGTWGPPCPACRPGGGSPVPGSCSASAPARAPPVTGSLPGGAAGLFPAARRRTLAGSTGTARTRGMAQELGEWTAAPAEASGLYRAMLLRSASMYSEIQRERADIGGLMARPEYREWNPELIKPKKLLNPVKASRSHQELHRELLMNHRRGLGLDSKPELQRVLEHRRRNQLIKKKKEELEAKRLQCPFEQELLRRQQRLSQLENPPQKEEDHTPEFIKVRENLRRIATLTSEERVL